MQNLSRLDESNEEDAKGVNTTMGVLENLLEVCMMYVYVRVFGLFPLVGFVWFSSICSDFVHFFSCLHVCLAVLATTFESRYFEEKLNTTGS